VAETVEAHRVQPGDRIRCNDGKFRHVLTAFGENTASASATVWAIYCYAEGEPTTRIAGWPSDEHEIERKVAA
jgi:hypothetical protein